MKILLIVLIALCVTLSGCRTEWYENGQKKSEGAIDWSSGKSLNFSVIGK